MRTLPSEQSAAAGRRRRMMMQMQRGQRWALLALGLKQKQKKQVKRRRRRRRKKEEESREGWGWEGLPVELQERVLAMLPFSDLLPLRKVCKSWASLPFTSPSFSKLHAQLAPRQAWFLLRTGSPCWSAARLRYAILAVELPRPGLSSSSPRFTWKLNRQTPLFHCAPSLIRSLQAQSNPLRHSFSSHNPHFEDLPDSGRSPLAIHLDVLALYTPASAAGLICCFSPSDPFYGNKVRKRVLVFDSLTGSLLAVLPRHLSPPGSEWRLDSMFVDSVQHSFRVVLKDYSLGSDDVLQIYDSVSGSWEVVPLPCLPRLSSSSPSSSSCLLLQASSGDHDVAKLATHARGCIFQLTPSKDRCFAFHIQERSWIQLGPPLPSLPHPLRLFQPAVFSHKGSSLIILVAAIMESPTKGQGFGVWKLAASSSSNTGATATHWVELARTPPSLWEGEGCFTVPEDFEALSVKFTSAGHLLCMSAIIFLDEPDDTLDTQYWTPLFYDLALDRWEFPHLPLHCQGWNRFQAVCGLEPHPRVS